MIFTKIQNKTNIRVILLFYTRVVFYLILTDQLNSVTNKNKDNFPQEKYLILKNHKPSN